MKYNKNNIIFIIIGKFPFFNKVRKNLKKNNFLLFEYVSKIGIDSLKSSHSITSASIIFSVFIKNKYYLQKYNLFFNIINIYCIIDY